MEDKKYSNAFIWRQRIGYGISDYACNLAYLMVNTYLLIFYTDVVGLNAAAVGTMFVGTKLFDAFTDYLVGACVDRTNSKMGRNRPYMLFGAPVLALGMILLFKVPDFSQTGKMVYATATYILFSFGYTLVNIPMGSILPTLTADPMERTKLATSRSIFSTLGSLTSASMALFLIAKLGNGDDAQGYFYTNIVFGILVVIIMIICVACVREINPPLESKEKSNLIHDLKYMVNNKPYMLMLALTFFLFVGYLGMFATLAYYFTYVVGNVNYTSTALSIMTLVPILSMVITPSLNKKLCKRDIQNLGAAIQIVGYVILFFSFRSIPMIMVGVVISAFGMGFRQCLFFSMLADTVDYGEWKNGKNLAGTQQAVSGFINKLASATATAVVGYVLTWGGYDGMAETQPESAIMAIRIATCILPVVCLIGCIVVMLFYDLDKKHPQIIKEINERRASAAKEE